MRSTRWLVGFGLSMFLSCSTLALASEGGGHGAPAAGAEPKGPEAMIKAVVDGNDSFKSHHDSHYFDAYQSGQVPNLTVVACSDSRVHTPLFGMDPHNNIFVIRNIGNQIATAEGSVDYGVRHLPTSILLVMGHSSCGAVKAAMGNYSRETAGIRKELDSLRPVVASDDGEGPFEGRWAKNVERNVDFQVEQALKLYADKVNLGQMAVVGGVYDFNDNYGRGRGSLVITNINGEKEPNKLMNDAVLKELEKAQVVNHVGSLAP